MSADLKALLEAQTDIHGRMSRSVDNLRKMGVTNITAGAIQARLTILENLWAKFEAQHELIRTALKDRYLESEYAKNDFIDTAECTYVSQRSTLSNYADKLRAESVVAHRIEPKSESSPKTALPRIKLPPFSGAYENWPSFRELFLSLVGENPSVSNIERFHYLRFCMKGSAEKLIRSLTVTSENYDRAWAILAKHFENKKELMRSNFSTFTAVGKIKSESEELAEELSRIHHAVTATVNAQESIGRPINSHGMDLLNHLVIELFDSRTRLEWESSTSDSPDPPTHEALTDFISKRILTLNAAKPKIATKSAGETSRTAKSHFVKNGPDASKCAACKGKHTLMQCPEFKSKSASERKSFVEVSGLCFNCLGNHMMAKCQSIKTCFMCKSRHHTLLHDAYTTPTSHEASTFSTTRTSHDKRATLLATARVTLTDRLGRPQDVRALLDQGSEVSLVSEDLAQRLRLARTRSSMSIIGIGGAHSGSTRGRVTLALKSRVTGAPLTVAAYVLPRLSSYQGPAIQGSTTWPHIHGLTLADP
ncbi:uncharacterized protein LOC112637995 [Camponotus floridanus]|uniref:uncharacterized protein LOC112637995 n=1 Tax=Camponotus floridanus TaxID=104421 RepID=UPI000DC6A5CD|nr:uncharacterized protein LOC112637995 [Camponotus floridanus]